MATLSVIYNGSGATIYAIIRRMSDGYVWNGSAFVTYANASIGSYDVPLTDRGGDFYSATFPSGIAYGTYLCTYYLQAGGSPAIGDLSLGSEEISSGGASGTGTGGPYLTTLANLKTFMGITSSTYDAKLNMAIVLATKQIRSYCDRDLTAQSYADRYDGNGTGLNPGYISLRNVPVTDVSSVTFNPDSDTPTIVDGNEFTVDAETGFLQYKNGSNYARSFPIGFNSIKVEYDAGYDTIPEDVDLSCCMVASALYQSMSRDPSIVEEKIGDYSYKTGGYVANGSNPGAMYNAIPILAEYKRVGAL